MSSVQAGPGAGLEGGDIPGVAGTPGAAGEWAALRRLHRTQAAGLQSQASRLLPSSRVKAPATEGGDGQLTSGLPSSVS